MLALSLVSSCDLVMGIHSHACCSTADHQDRPAPSSASGILAPSPAILRTLLLHSPGVEDTVPSACSCSRCMVSP